MRFEEVPHRCHRPPWMRYGKRQANHFGQYLECPFKRAVNQNVDTAIARRVLVHERITAWQRRQDQTRGYFSDLRAHAIEDRGPPFGVCLLRVVNLLSEIAQQIDHLTSAIVVARLEHSTEGPVPVNL